MKIKVLCTKTYHSYVGNDNLRDNGIDTTNLDGEYPIFEKGKEYEISKPMKTLPGNYIIVAYADLVIKCYDREDHREILF